MRANVQERPFAWGTRLVLIALLSAATMCPAQEGMAPRRRVAVLGFKNLRNDENTDWVGAVTAETLTTKLAGVRALTVIEREQIQKVVEEQDLQATVLVDPNAAVETGRLLGAQSVVVGSFVVAEGQVRFNVRIVDVESGEVLDAVTQGGAQADVMNLPVYLAEKVVQSLSFKVAVQGGEKRVVEAGPAPALSEKEKQKLAEAPTASAEAYEAYGRGVALNNKHRWREAQTEFERAVQLDPSFALAWRELGNVYNKQGAWPRAMDCYAKAESLFRAKSDEKNLAATLNNMGLVHRAQGRYDEALKLYEESLAMSRRLGDEPTVAIMLGNMANVYDSQGRYAEAMELHEESLAMSRRLGDESGVARTLNNMGEVHREQGRYHQAMKLYEESLAMRRRLGDEPGVAATLYNMALVHQARTEYTTAMPLAQEAKQIAHRLGLSYAGQCDELVADLERQVGR